MYIYNITASHINLRITNHVCRSVKIFYSLLDSIFSYGPGEWERQSERLSSDAKICLSDPQILNTKGI